MPRSPQLNSLSNSSSRWARPLTFLGLLAVATPFCSLQAHDSPEHVVEMLTARMETVGRRPDLLWRRATEYRALNQLPEAEKDLRAVISKKPDFLQARIDLSRVQLATGNTRAALRTIRRALSSENGRPVDPGLHMMHAEILGASGRLEEAVAECDRALEAAGSPDAEWYLARCQFQYRLGHFKEAAAGLKRGVELTGNAVLEAEWVDAILDAGNFEEALVHISSQIEQSRCQAPWLIRRGRANAGLGRVSSAQQDFLAAITELNGRLGERRQDFTLLAERGFAYALLGDLEPARSDLTKARAIGADYWILNRLERTIASYD